MVVGGLAREETVKWNQMTALRFQRGGGTSNIPRPPFQAWWDVKVQELTRKLEGTNRETLRNRRSEGGGPGHALAPVHLIVTSQFPSV